MFHTKGQACLTVLFMPISDSAVAWEWNIPWRSIWDLGFTKVHSMSGKAIVPLLSPLRVAVGSAMVCLYQLFSWPQTYQGPYFLQNPSLARWPFADGTAVISSSASSPSWSCSQSVMNASTLDRTISCYLSCHILLCTFKGQPSALVYNALLCILNGESLSW